jgi:hypothetical protein
MSRIEWSEKLQRKMRRDPLPEIGILSDEMALRAIQDRRHKDASDFIEYFAFESRNMDAAMIALAQKLTTFIAENMGEEHLEKFWRPYFQQRAGIWLKDSVSAEDRLYRLTEFTRGHSGNFKVTEEEDRYVMKVDPCGGLHKLWRTNRSVVGLTKKAHPWSWGKKGIPYYCTHCCVCYEILPIEISGYPFAIKLPPEKPEDPCFTYYYKKQELIPEEYFTRLGKKKP